MKKIVYICVVFLLSIVSVFAEISVTINSSDTEIDISELIELRIDIQNSGNEALGSIEIPGLSENFNVIGQSVSQSVRTLNNVSTNATSILFTLKAKKSGEYRIGPLKIGDSLSNTIDVRVTGEDILIGGEQDIQVGNTPGDTENQDNDEQTNASEMSSPNETQDDTIPEEILSPSGSVLADIYGPKYIFPLSLKNNLLYILLVVLIILGYKIYAHIQKLQLQSVKKQEEIRENRIDYHKLLEDIERQYLAEKKEIFYAKLTQVFRLYLDNNVQAGLSSKTLEEVRQSLAKSPEILSLYEKIYFPEYNTLSDTPKDRYELIVSLKQELR